METEKVMISPETIMELMTERNIMPEDVYQDLIKQEDCQKHKKLLAFTTIFIMKIAEKWEIKPSLDTVLLLSATHYLKIVEIIAD